MPNSSVRTLLTAVLLACAIAPPLVDACTGIVLKAQDGSVLFGRTMEWGSFDLHSRLIIIPRNHKFTSVLSDNKPGLTWTSKYGVAGIDGANKDIVIDGMNEKGLQVGLFYHPGTAVYQTFDPAQADKSLAPTDVGTYLLTTCATVDDARAAIAKIRVVPVIESAIGIVAAVHFVITEPSGKSIVVEYLKGQPTIFENELGVITNSPSYDWHETNMRNYINLSPVAIPDKKFNELDFKPLGGGSGMIGLPGDFTPPSRFVRAVAFTATARRTDSGPETVYEIFRILDNFNVPLGAAEAGGTEKLKGMRSSTLWTSCYDTKNPTLYYHTMNNRRVRQVDFNKLDFNNPSGITHQPLDKVPEQDIENVTPTK